MVEERRTGERYDAQISTVFLDQEGLNFGRIINISHGGMFLECTKPIAPNTLVKVLAHSSQKPVMIQGRIVYPKTENGMQARGLGIEFMELDNQAKAVRDDILISLMYVRHALPQWPH